MKTSNWSLQDKKMAAAIAGGAAGMAILPVASMASGSMLVAGILLSCGIKGVSAKILTAIAACGTIAGIIMLLASSPVSWATAAAICARFGAQLIWAQTAGA